MIITGTILLLLALFLGLNLPDLDHQISFFVHRSIITHGFLIPLGVFVLIYREKASIARFISAGFSLASAIHLCFDLFPRAWVGFALIHIPFWGRTNALFSWLWISLSIIICLYLTFALIEGLEDLLMAIASLGLAFSFYASTEPTIWMPLITLLASIGITLALPANSRTILRETAVKWKKLG